MINIKDMKNDKCYIILTKESTYISELDCCIRSVVYCIPWSINNLDEEKSHWKDIAGYSYDYEGWLDYSWLSLYNIEKINEIERYELPSYIYDITTKDNVKQ